MRCNPSSAKSPLVTPTRPLNGTNGQGTQNPSINVDDFIAIGMLETVTENENEESSAQYSEARLAEERREAKELEVVKAKSLTQEKRERKRRKEEMQSKQY